MKVLQQSYRPLYSGKKTVKKGASSHCHVVCPLNGETTVVTCSKCEHCAKLTFSTVHCKHDEQVKADV